MGMVKGCLLNMRLEMQSFSFHLDFGVLWSEREVPFQMHSVFFLYLFSQSAQILFIGSGDSDPMQRTSMA